MKQCCYTLSLTSSEESRGEVLPLIDDRIFSTSASVAAIRLSRWMPWYTVSTFVESVTVPPRRLLMANCILTTFRERSQQDFVTSPSLHLTSSMAKFWAGEEFLVLQTTYAVDRFYSFQFLNSDDPTLTCYQIICYLSRVSVSVSVIISTCHFHFLSSCRRSRFAAIASGENFRSDDSP